LILGLDPVQNSIMKTSIIFTALWVAIMSGLLTLSAPVYGEGADMLNQARDLVHQAWNPGGDAPSDAQRTDLLTQALELAKDSPQRHVARHRLTAILDIKAALLEIKRGDPDHKVTDYLRDADLELRTALSIAN
jgi:hypothetical protein